MLQYSPQRDRQRVTSIIGGLFAFFSCRTVQFDDCYCHTFDVDVLWGETVNDLHIGTAHM